VRPKTTASVDSPAGYGGRRDLLRFDAFDPETPDPTFRFRRTDTDDTVAVTYHVGDVP